MQIPFRRGVQRGFRDDDTLAFLLAQPLQRGGVEVTVKAHDGFPGRSLLVAGAVELVGGDLCYGRELHVELKSALAQSAESLCYQNRSALPHPRCGHAVSAVRALPLTVGEFFKAQPRVVR